MIDVGAPAEEVGVLLELNVPKSFCGRGATKYYMQAIAWLDCQAIVVGASLEEVSMQQGTEVITSIYKIIQI